MAVTAKVYDTAGTLQATFDETELVDVGWTEERNRVGFGTISIAYDNADAAEASYRRYVRLLDSGSERFAFYIDERELVRQSEDQEGGRILRISGPGVGLFLGTSEIGGGVVLPSKGVDGFQSDVRMFGWMDCACFDHSGWTDTLNVNHNQKDPVPPWTVRQPADWPDPLANRIWTDAPTGTGGTDEVQEITLGTSINSGTFTLTFEGQTTGAISSPWSAANVETALEALSTIDGVTVTGAGIDSDPYVITFDGANVAKRDVDLLDIDHSSLNHTPNTASVTATTKGVKATYSTPASCVYFHHEFTTASDLDLFLFVNMKQTGQVWIDGVKVYEQTSSAAARSTQNRTLSLPSGSHCITAKVCKKGSNGVAWFMLSLAQATENADGGIDLGTVVDRTGGGWDAHETTVNADPPGVTAGAIAGCLRTEAQTDGNLVGVTDDFTDTADSGTTAWADELVWGIPVGTGLLDAISQLVELIGGVWRMGEDLTLSMWGTRGTDKTGSVIFAETAGGGLSDSEYAGRGPKATRLLIETQEGLATAADAAAVTSYGQATLGVTLGTAPTLSGLADFATETFATFARPVVLLDAGTPGVSGLTPYTAFVIDDLVTAPDEDGVAADHKAMVFHAVLADSAGNLAWAVELDKQ